MENRGVWVSHSTVTAGAIAGGDHAVAVNQSAPAQQSTLEELREAVRQLTRTVEAEADALEDPGQALTVARLAEKEAAKDAPDKSALSGFLTVLTSGAGAVSGLATAVTAVKTVLQGLM